MNVGKYSRTDIMSKPEVQKRISKEWNEKKKLFSHLDPDHLGNAYAHPRDSHVTSSPFYKKRIYEQFEIKNGKKVRHKAKISYHRGFDFRAKTGDTVFAMGGGKVALAKELYFEGNCVWIDHGNKILSVYMHMSKLNVYKGQMVKPGQLIGYVGSTGVSTGPHLHVALFIDSVPTDPMSLLALPLRK